MGTLRGLLYGLEYLIECLFLQIGLRQTGDDRAGTWEEHSFPPVSTSYVTITITQVYTTTNNGFREIQIYTTENVMKEITTIVEATGNTDHLKDT